MIIGEAPGREEDASGQPFVGAAGRFLNQVLTGSGLRREELFITLTIEVPMSGIWCRRDIAQVSAILSKADAST